MNNDPWCSLENPLFGEIDQPGVGRVMAPRVPLQFAGSPAAGAVPAPQLGGDTDGVLTEALGFAAAEVTRLRGSATIDDGR